MSPTTHERRSRLRKSEQITAAAVQSRARNAPVLTVATPNDLVQGTEADVAARSPRRTVTLNGNPATVNADGTWCCT